MVLGRDEAACNLSEFGFRAWVEKMFGNSKAARVIDMYKKTHPEINPNEPYFLLSTHRGTRIVAVGLEKPAERKFA